MSAAPSPQLIAASEGLVPPRVASQQRRDEATVRTVLATWTVVASNHIFGRQARDANLENGGVAERSTDAGACGLSALQTGPRDEAAAGADVDVPLT